MSSLELLRRCVEHLPEILDGSDPREWDSLIVNRRRPHTFRAFTYIDDVRICLHRFELCTPDEAFAHPHPWPAAFMVVGGQYHQRIYAAKTLDTIPWYATPITEMVAGPGFEYVIDNPLTFHSIRPVTDPATLPKWLTHYPTSAYSVMVNGAPWDKDKVHEMAPTTAGKDLDKMTPDELQNHLDTFLALLLELPPRARS